MAMHAGLTILAGDVTTHCRRGTCDLAGVKENVLPRIVSHPKVSYCSIRNRVMACYCGKLQHRTP